LDEAPLNPTARPFDANALLACGPTSQQQALLGTALVVSSRPAALTDICGGIRCLTKQRLSAVHNLKRGTGLESAGSIGANESASCTCETFGNATAAQALQTGDPHCLCVSQLDADLQSVIVAWEGLSDFSRAAIRELVGRPKPSKSQALSSTSVSS
jgi:hypothetical protein